MVWLRRSVSSECPWRRRKVVDREGRKAEEAHRTVDTGPVNVMVTFWGWGGVPIGRLAVYTSSSRRRSARNGVEKDTCIVAMEEHTMVMVSMTRKVEEKFFIVW